MKSSCSLGRDLQGPLIPRTGIANECQVWPQSRCTMCMKIWSEKRAHAAASNEDMAVALQMDRMGNRSLYAVRALGRRARGGKGACVCAFLAARPFCNSGSMPTSTACCSGSTLESSWPSCCLYSRRSDFWKIGKMFRLWMFALRQASRKKLSKLLAGGIAIWSFWHGQHCKNGSFDLCCVHICLWRSVAPKLDTVIAH